MRRAAGPGEELHDLLRHVLRADGRGVDHCHADELPVRGDVGRTGTDGNDGRQRAGDGADPGRLPATGAGPAAQPPVFGAQRRGLAAQTARDRGGRRGRDEPKGNRPRHEPVSTFRPPVRRVRFAV